VNLSDRVADLMTITKLYTVFDIYDNESDAVSSFNVQDEAITDQLDSSDAAKANSSLL